MLLTLQALEPLTPISAICPMRCKFRADLVLSKKAITTDLGEDTFVLWPVNVGGVGGAL